MAYRWLWVPRSGRVEEGAVENAARQPAISRDGQHIAISRAQTLTAETLATILQKVKLSDDGSGADVDLDACASGSNGRLQLCDHPRRDVRAELRDVVLREKT